MNAEAKQFQHRESDLLAEIDRLREALSEIAQPIVYMQKRAEAEGARLNHMAIAIANDPNYLSGIAADALRKKTPTAAPLKGERP